MTPSNTFIVFLVVHSIILSVNAIKCFQCYMTQHPYYFQDDVIVKTCNDMDYSHKFIVDCPESTFCFKRVVNGIFYKQGYTREERGCAPQTYKGEKFDSTLGWMMDKRIVGDAYQDGCKTVEDQGIRTLKIEECYCDSYELCNSSFKPKTYILPITFPLILIIIIITQ
ncbi:hypothetical protein ABEB36_001484 [Hypothenemus hampei]|uniref:Protein quiver n=1 Tax=Hypothenemus hampei TaxID=57062 RepID=A0ABD1FI94_HYPHA